MLLGRGARCAALTLAILIVGSVQLGRPVQASSSLEERKLPMRFAFHQSTATDCISNCRGWVSAVGVIDGDSLRQFNELANAHDLRGATVVLDSGGGSVLDAIALGKRWRGLKLSTVVGATVNMPAGDGKAARTDILPNAYCESMCVFLLLSGVQRYVPPGAHIRVHQIWMGDRADDAKAANYNAEDVMIIERDVGRLAHYTFDMGGTGELLGLALSVPPWDALRELTTEERRRTNLVTTELMADVWPGGETELPAVALSGPKLHQDRIAPDTTRTAEAKAPTGGEAK
jgi:hypothetical protein